MKLNIEAERESDGRWLAEVLELPGVITYGKTSSEAVKNALSLTLRVLADRIEHGEALIAEPKKPSADKDAPIFEVSFAAV
jgi:predicted RNase H-like HicB family nuclease